MTDAVIDFLYRGNAFWLLLGFVALCFALVHFWKPRFPRTFRGRVVWVCDGDTIWVRTVWGFRRKIRLSGMDAPESEQKWGEESQQCLDGLVGGRLVNLTAVAKDMYGRWVCKVECGGVDASLYMIEAGLAWPYYYYLKSFPADERRRYLAAGNEAKRNRRGMWRDGTPEAPWDWRRRHKPLWKKILATLKRLLRRIFWK